VPLPKTKVAVGQIVNVQDCITEQAATPSCSPLSKNLLVNSPLVPETASMGQEANTPSLNTYCSAAERSRDNNEGGNIIKLYTDSAVMENTQEIMSLEFCDTYCSDAEQLMKIVSIKFFKLQRKVIKQLVFVCI
jgi:hypothetical protein